MTSEGMIEEFETIARAHCTSICRDRTIAKQNNCQTTTGQPVLSVLCK